MKTTAALILFLLLAFSLAAESISGKVTLIYDGDTFLMQDGLKSVEIRLWGIDAPEYKQSGGRGTKFLIRLIKTDLSKWKKLTRQIWQSRRQGPLCQSGSFEERSCLGISISPERAPPGRGARQKADYGAIPIHQSANGANSRRKKKSRKGKAKAATPERRSEEQ
jgi:hypothetical protein